MFVIVNKSQGPLHSEPTRQSYRSKSYKSAGAAKAGITRTVKYYAKAIQQVADVVAEGKPEYHASMYNAYRDATEDRSDSMFSNRNYDYRNVCNGTDLEVVAHEDYVEPQITRTGTSPYDGREITVTTGINSIGTHMDPLCESHYTN